MTDHIAADQSGVDELSDTDILMIADHYGVPMSVTVGAPHCGNFLAAVRDIIARSAPTQPVETAEQKFTSAASFKNFHRALCDRFGYSHDEQFWWRDLVSIEEHIAAKVSRPSPAPAVAGEAITDSMRMDLVENRAFIHVGREGRLQEATRKNIDAAIRAMKTAAPSKGEE